MRKETPAFVRCTAAVLNRTMFGAECTNALAGTNALMAGTNATIPIASKTAMAFAILRRLSEDVDVVNSCKAHLSPRTKDPFVFAFLFSKHEPSN